MNRARSLFGFNPRVTQTCAGCGRQFLASLSKVNRGRGRCCSLSCNAKSRKKPFAELFWPRVEKTATCWLWTGPTIRAYGKVPGGRLAHRCAWELFRGPIPLGQQVLHECDTPLCVRPDHLFLGTVKDNSDDKVRKNRQAKHKLTAEQVKKIRKSYAAGTHYQHDLAKQYGVCQQLISRIVRQKLWLHTN